MSKSIFNILFILIFSQTADAYAPVINGSSNKKILKEINELIQARDFNILNKYTPFLASNGITDSEDLVKFTLSLNPEIDINYAREIAESYIREAKDEGINHDIAYAQMLLETGILKFSGQVNKVQNNFSGLGVINSFVKGHKFKDIQEGIKAHIQHLKAYATTKNVNSILVDPRFHLVKRGSAITIYDLTGKWATDKDYDKKIKKILLNLLYYSQKDKF